MFIKNKAQLDDLQLKANTQSHMECFYNNKHEAKSLSLFLVKSIAREFENQCRLMQQNLLLSSLQKPVYGSLAAIRSLIVQSVDEIKSSQFSDEWKEIINNLIDLSFTVSKVTSSIVNSSSPEGIFPTELIQMQPDLVNSELVKHVTPQMLLVCCWRTMKEISLFFGDIVTHLPIENESNVGEKFILSETRVFTIGDYFVRHLFEMTR